MIADSGFLQARRIVVVVVDGRDTPTYMPTSQDAGVVIVRADSNSTCNSCDSISIAPILRGLYRKEDLPRMPEFWELPPKIPPKHIRPTRGRTFQVNSPRTIFQPCWRTGRWRSLT